MKETEKYIDKLHTNLTSRLVSEDMRIFNHHGSDTSRMPEVNIRSTYMILSFHIIMVSISAELT